MSQNEEESDESSDDEVMPRLPDGRPDFDALDWGDLQEFCRNNSIDLLDIPIKGRKKKKVKILREKLKSYPPLKNYNSTMLQEKQKEYQKCSHELAGIASTVRDAVAQLPHGLERNEEIESKQKSIADMVELIKDATCKILVFGDVNNGKSTFFNLLVGEEIVHSAAIAASSTIAEVSYYPERIMTAVVKKHVVEEEKCETEEKLDLSGVTFKDAKQLVRQFTARKDTNTEFRYSHVKIGWPSEFLKTGLVLVDSPGLNEDRDILDPLVEEFIPQSHSTICIIDANHGSITQTMRDIIDKVKGQEYFDPDSMFFIVTKIDTVYPRERELVMNSVWNGLPEVIKRKGQAHRDTHLFGINLLAAQKVQTEQLQYPDFAMMLDALTLHLSKIFRIKLQVSHTKLNEILVTVEQTLNYVKKLRNKTKNQRKDMLRDLGVTLEDLSKKQFDFASKLKTLAQKRQDNLVDVIRKRLESKRRDIIKVAASSERPEKHELSAMYPMVSNKHQKLTHYVHTNVINSISEELRSLEYTALEYREEFAQIAQELFSDLLQEINSVETDIFGKSRGLLEDEVDDHSLPLALQIAALPGYVVLGAVALVGGVVGAFPYGIYKSVQFAFRKHKIKHIWTDIEAYKQFACTVAEDTLDDILNAKRDSQKSLNYLVSKNFLNVELMATHLLKRLEGRIHEVGDLANKVHKADIDDESFLIEEELARQKLALASEMMAIFKMLYLKQYSIKWEQLSHMTPLKTRHLRDNIRATLALQPESKNQEPITEPVMLKPLDKSQYSQFRTFLREEDIRTLLVDNPYVLKFYGACHHEGSDYFVLEYVGEHTLMTYLDLLDKPTDDTDESYETILHIARCIAKGLQTIHQRDVCHRNITPTSILLSADLIAPKVKIADFAHAKLNEDVSGSQFHSMNLAFIAPEMYKKVYDFKVDVYAFGMILWILWHQRDPSRDAYHRDILSQDKPHMTNLQHSSFELPFSSSNSFTGSQQVAFQYPRIEENCPIPFKELILGCWDSNPSHRLPLLDIIKKLNGIIDGTT